MRPGGKSNLITIIFSTRRQSFHFDSWAVAGEDKLPSSASGLTVPTPTTPMPAAAAAATATASRRRRSEEFQSD
jgi:hypothetical protein